jgi:GDP-mannose 6-dehydrogenase
VSLLEKYSGNKAGVGFAVAMYPEFLREGSAARDYMAPPYVVVGVDEHDAEVAQAIHSLARCFGSTAALFVMPPEQAEMLKLVCNAWHALKVAFANEVGVLCRGAGVDSRQLMDVFVRDTHLNIGPAYLRPGFAYGGSCLGKDLRALMTLGDKLEEPTYLLDAVVRSNWKHIERAAEVVAYARGRRLGFIGFGHEPGSGDLRSSQMLALLKFIQAQNPGVVVRAYDRHVPLDRDTGDVQIEIAGEIRDVLNWCDVLVVATTEPAIDYAALRPGITIVDLTGAGAQTTRLTIV